MTMSYMMPSFTNKICDVYPPPIEDVHVSKLQALVFGAVGVVRGVLSGRDVHLRVGISRDDELLAGLGHERDARDGRLDSSR